MAGRIQGVDVLLVEDDYAIRDMMTLTLEEEGYHVVSVADGQQALRYLRSSAPQPALLVLDLWLPGKNGFAVLRELGCTPELAALPVVVTSADSSVASKLEALGVQYYLPKPVTMSLLLGIVARVCQQV